VGNPLVATAHASTAWYTGLGLVEDAAQVSSGVHNNSWVDGTLGGVGGSLDMLGMVVDPLGSLVSWGVSWLMEHVKPLQEALDWLAGNPDEVAAHAATWENVAQFSIEAAERYAAAVDSQITGWQGDSGDAYRDRAGTHVLVMRGVSTAAHAISYAVQGTGLLVGLVRGIVRDLIAQFVATLAARLPQWLAEEGLTLGFGTPVVVGQVGALVAKWVNKIQHFVRALLNSLRRLRPLVDRLGKILTDLKDLLRKLGRAGGEADPLAPKPREEYEYNMVDNPGPLAGMPSNPAVNFAGGRYDEVTLTEDRVFYRAGVDGKPLGRWFSLDPPSSVAQVRIDTAVRPQWINQMTGEWTGASPLDTVYAVKIPDGTKVYVGPVASQGDIYVGGGHQIYIPAPKGYNVIGSTPLP
jgi:uncharacterized membrane protein YeaQ/YmgE (transglycosylase-associated protein family)